MDAIRRGPAVWWGLLLGASEKGSCLSLGLLHAEAFAQCSDVTGRGMGNRERQSGAERDGTGAIRDNMVGP